MSYTDAPDFGPPADIEPPPDLGPALGYGWQPAPRAVRYPYTIHLFGTEWLVERVKLNDLPEWMDEHGVQYNSTAYLGAGEPIALHWPHDR